METAIDKLKSEWISQDELADLFGVSARRIQDMKSTGRLLIPTCKLSSKAYYYHLSDVNTYMSSLRRLYREEEDYEGEEI